MNNYAYPEGADNSNAPWNEKQDVICEDCGSIMHVNDTGIIRNIVWHEYICLECGNIKSEEPDYD